MYLARLKKCGIVKKKGGKWCLYSGELSGFGETLEWYVAQIFRKELSSHAVWGAKISGLTSGGDFDVLANVEGRLLYIEAKSAPPKGIDNPNIDAFFVRLEALRPDGVILLDDTTLRMADKLLPMCEKKLGRSLDRLFGETFCLGSRFFLTNSHPDLADNLKRCVAALLRSKSL